MVRKRIGSIAVAAFALMLGSSSAAGGASAKAPDKGYIQAQAWVRSQVSGVWKDPLPSPCDTFLLPTEPCLYTYKGATLFPRGIVMTPDTLPKVPWLPLSLEILEATTITVIPTSLTECEYTASGIASGPYPGTFTQTGVIQPGVFSGSATITSDVQTIEVSLSGELPDRACVFLLSGAPVEGPYVASGTGQVDPDDEASRWSDFGRAKVWLDPTRGFLSEVFSSERDAALASLNLPSSPCPPTGCV